MQKVLKANIKRKTLAAVEMTGAIAKKTVPDTSSWRYWTVECLVRPPVRTAHSNAEGKWAGEKRHEFWTVGTQSAFFGDFFRSNKTEEEFFPSLFSDRLKWGQHKKSDMDI